MSLTRHRRPAAEGQPGAVGLDRFTAVTVLNIGRHAAGRETCRTSGAAEGRIRILIDIEEPTTSADTGLVPQALQ